MTNVFLNLVIIHYTNISGLQEIPSLSPLDMFNKQSMQTSPQTTLTQTSQLQQLPSTQPSSSLQLVPTTTQMMMMGAVERERHESASTDRESEIRRIFDQGSNKEIFD